MPGPERDSWRITLSDEIGRVILVFGPLGEAKAIVPRNVIVVLQRLARGIHSWRPEHWSENVRWT